MIRQKSVIRTLAALLMIAALVFPAQAFAAAGDVTSISFDDSAKKELVIGQSAKQLKVYAVVEGSSTKKDITASAAWSSSDEDVAQVVKGLVTPKSSGDAIITAVYEGAVATVEVSASYPYTKLALEAAKSGTYKLGDSAGDLKIAAKATGGEEKDAVTDVTSLAVWSSSSSSVLTVDAGQITLVGKGTATITAKYQGLTATYKATVELPYSSLELRQSGKAVSQLELLVGDEVSLKSVAPAAGGSGEHDITADANWSSSASGVVSVEGGVLTVASAGKATITAQYLGVTASVDVYVRAPYEALLLEPSDSVILFMDETLPAKAEVRDRANSSLDVSDQAKWTSSNPLAATVSGGRITAKALGTSTIKADYGGISKELKVTVYPTLTDLQTEKSEFELFRDESQALPKISGVKLDKTKLDLSGDLKWTSSDDEIVSIESGKFHAKSEGTVTLSAALPEADSVQTPSSNVSVRGEKIEIKVTVNEKVLVLLGPDETLSLVVGESSSLPEVDAVWENGAEKDVSSLVKWTVSGTNVVLKTTEDGQTIKGLTKGSATLKGTYLNKTISVPVKVEQKIVKIVVEPTAVELNIKKSKAIKVTGYYANGSKVSLGSKVGWESSDPDVATVTGASVKGVAVGTATLSGSYQGYSLSAKVSVVPKLTKLTVNEKTLKLAPGAKATAIVTATYDTGAEENAAGATTWTSSKPAVATISASGQISALTEGKTTIKGKFGSKTFTISVTVKNQ
ncbi:Ig-like domain-containing protein [Saccharibacillus sp. CPCC 101409]|uniref:Ig-like domain-containing protein n=1 Tax=Saccharibacillus sp. CPCC 101409 TaxID=3058041 RepID=UPI002671513B|nr:Ig-like domain-containing protein [Saccharibacillus sp. CPCC 101409]MDO3408536.1 Ig-like domain-containing protein [Saccharibacillus sp. CPCC 101409]